METLERCSICILPARLPGIKLNDSGKCNYCVEFEKSMKADQSRYESLKIEFENILEKKRGKGLYDCLVPVSGGKDSMYVLYVLSRVYDMKVLAFNMNNGFQSPVARKNIKNAVKKVGAELITYTPSESSMNKLFRIFLSQAGEICSPCNNLIHSSSERIARQNGIPLVVEGGGGRWSASIRGASISKYSNYPYYFRVVKDKILPLEVKKYMPKSTMDYTIDRLLSKKPKFISLFNYYNTQKNHFLETIERELDWIPPSQELEHGDCLLNPLKDYLVCKKWGFSEITGGYSTQVRNGKMTREDALKKAEAEEVRKPPEILETFLKRIGMTYNDFEEATKRHFSDISNDSGRIYNLIKKIYHFVRR